MNLDTPIHEVAQHMPQEAAAFLMRHSEEVQIATLTQIRSIVAYFETKRVVMDPIAYDAILRGMTLVLAPLYEEITRLRDVNARLSSQVEGADTLISGMAQTISELQEGKQ